MVALSGLRVADNVLVPCAVAALGGVNMKQDKNFLGKNKITN
jgi:hypothetical protein